ncbi:MAG: hypothetical protein HZA03_03150 [Nitrospinae bacterium]|nr:hypothetical protein [Nitrospinota bacterium]
MSRNAVFFTALFFAAALVAVGSGVAGIPQALAQNEAAAKAPADAQDQIRMEMAKDLQKKQEELRRREEELNAREGQLKTLEADIQKKIEELKITQLKLEELVKLRDDLEAKNVTTLAKAYATMPAPDAAARLKAMDRATALRILMVMKAQNASKILSSLDAATAAQITEQLAKRRTEQ